MDDIFKLFGVPNPDDGDGDGDGVFSKRAHRALAKSVGATLQSGVGDPHNLQFTIVPVATRSDGQECIFQLHARVCGAGGPEKDAWEEHCEDYGLEPSLLGRMFKWRKHKYEVWGLSSAPGCSDAVVLCRRDDGMIYPYGVEAILDIFEKGGAA